MSQGPRRLSNEAWEAFVLRIRALLLQAGVDEHDGNKLIENRRVESVQNIICGVGTNASSGTPGVHDTGQQPEMKSEKRGLGASASRLHRYSRLRSLIVPAAGLLILSSCVSAPESGTRLHDSRQFTPAAEIAFEAQPGARAFYGTYDGIQGPAVYAAEFPANWDGGGLVMFTHGYRGVGGTLSVSVPSAAFREAVLASGYAWAASSYSANFYDVRAGIEDTNKLALQLPDLLAQDWNTTIPEPSQYLIAGSSLGGHTAAAAVERENMMRTRYPVPYAGAAPFCQAEQNQFQWLGDYTRLVQTLSGYGYMPYSAFPQLYGSTDDDGQFIPGPALTSLFKIDPQTGQPTWEPASLNGERLMQIAMYLTGGERPVFEIGFRSRFQNTVLSGGGDDGTVRGILDRNIYDNTNRVYRWTAGDQPTDEELAFNESVPRVAAVRGVNSPRGDGVRWLPEVHGDFDVPVLTMHTLGDFYVPFRHQQLYREGAQRHGSDELLVQRAIRAPGHCDFSPQETRAAITEWIVWVNGGPKPEGDDVLSPEVVASAQYGCTFTVPDRPGIVACAR